MVDARVTGLRIRRLRLISQLDQTEFARRIGLASGSVSKVENGLFPLTNASAERIASVLSCNTEFLLSEMRIPVPTRPWLRAYADASQKVVDRQIADCCIAYQAVEHLKLRRIPDKVPTFTGDLHDDNDIEEFARDVRVGAGIAEQGVLRNSMRAAERLGCVVLPMASELGRHLGLSLRVGSIPFICVSRPSDDPGKRVPGDRQRFTVAHEIGHLALHSAVGQPQTADEAAQIERQAHRFAGALLAPADAILAELDSLGGRITLTTLAKIKERWGIAIKALVMRFRQLNAIDDDAARSLYKQISARGWNLGEPVPVGNESAVWIEKAVVHWAGKSMTDSTTLKAAAAVGLGVEHITRWIDWSPTSTNGSPNVVSIQSARQRHAARS